MAALWLGEVDFETKRAILTALIEAKVPSRSILLAQDQPKDHLSFLIVGTASIE
jgi:CRP/FNR family transcriptional regulator, cyclic AMP receptor protein